MRSDEMRNFTGFMASYVPIGGAETPEATETNEETPETPSVDLSPLMERMDEVSGRIDEVAQRLPEQQQQGAPEDELGLGYGGYGQPQQPSEQQQGQFDPARQQQQPYDPYSGDAQTDPEAALQLVRDEAQRAAQAVMQPHMRQQYEQRREAEFEQLLDDYPEIQEREAQQALSGDANQWAEDIAGSILGANPQLAQAVASTPAFIELVHLAAKTAERAGQETPAGSEQAVELQGGSAANPGGGEAQANLGERIKEAGTGDPFWIGARRS